MWVHCLRQRCQGVQEKRGRHQRLHTTLIPKKEVFLGNLLEFWVLSIWTKIYGYNLWISLSHKKKRYFKTMSNICHICKLQPSSTCLPAHFIYREVSMDFYRDCAWKTSMLLLFLRSTRPARPLVRANLWPWSSWSKRGLPMGFSSHFVLLLHKVL